MLCTHYTTQPLHKCPSRVQLGSYAYSLQEVYGKNGNKLILGRISVVSVHLYYIFVIPSLRNYVIQSGKTNHFGKF